MIITGGIVLAIIVLGSILIAKEYGESAEEHSAESSVSSAYSATGTMPNLAVPSPTGVLSRFPELQELMSGNIESRNETEEEHPGLVEELAQGQHPKVSVCAAREAELNAELFHLLPSSRIWDGQTLECPRRRCSAPTSAICSSLATCRSFVAHHLSRVEVEIFLNENLTLAPLVSRR
jgi:hypothetical protein